MEMTTFLRPLLGVCLFAASVAAPAQQPVATVLGANVALEDLAPASGDGARGAQLAGLVRARLFRDYVVSRGLAATPAEIAELRVYQAEFERKDRAQRRRKLAELESRLESADLTAAERVRLVDFRDALRRVAAREKAAAAEPASPAEREPDRAPLIELWKMHRALYEEFGGEVLLVDYGPYPKGAWLRLLAEHERAGNVRFSESVWRDRVFAHFGSVSGIRLSPETVDFTPYWKRPIPPSYYPEHVPDPVPDGG